MKEIVSMQAGQYYHIFNRGNSRDKIFYEECNYEYFMRRFNDYLSSLVEVYAYCLMPNHFHFFIEVGDYPVETVRKAFKNFFISYAKSINKKYDRTGSLFQANFRRKEIASESDFCSLIQYIHFNPVKAGLCDHFSKWKYSSYNAFLSGKPTKIDVPKILKWFGGRDEFIRFHEERRIEFEKYELNSKR